MKIKGQKNIKHYGSDVITVLNPCQVGCFMYVFNCLLFKKDLCSVLLRCFMGYCVSTHIFFDVFHTVEHIGNVALVPTFSLDLLTNWWMMWPVAMPSCL